MSKKGVTIKIFIGMDEGIEHGWLLCVCSTLERAQRRVESKCKAGAGDEPCVIEAAVDQSMDFNQFDIKNGYKKWVLQSDGSWEQETTN